MPARSPQDRFLCPHSLATQSYTPARSSWVPPRNLAVSLIRSAFAILSSSAPLKMPLLCIAIRSVLRRKAGWLADLALKEVTAGDGSSVEPIARPRWTPGGGAACGRAAVRSDGPGRDDRPPERHCRVKYGPGLHLTQGRLLPSFTPRMDTMTPHRKGGAA